MWQGATSFWMFYKINDTFVAPLGAIPNPLWVNYALTNRTENISQENFDVCSFEKDDIYRLYYYDIVCQLAILSLLINVNDVKFDSNIISSFFHKSTLY